MIATAYSSRPTGSKKLTLEGRQFGWETIEKIYDQEMKRMIYMIFLVMQLFT